MATNITIEKAIKGMLSGPETKRLMKRLRIYNKQTHFHHAQAPIPIDISNFSDTSQFNHWV